MKICTNDRCFFVGQLQPLENFCKDKNTKDGHKFRCKMCGSQYYQEIKEERIHYRKDHKEETKDYNKQYREENEEYFKVYNKQYYQNNKEKIKEQVKQYNQDHKKETNKHSKQRRQKDLSFRIAGNLRSRLYQAIQRESKFGSAVADLMMSITNFKFYLEERWYPNPETGEVMTWENYGIGWHIDHIIPLSAFDLTDRQQFKKACHYSNLRPMWAKQNISESDRGMSRNRQGMQNDEVKNI